MVHWPGVDLAAFPGRPDRGSHPEGERRRRVAGRDDDLCGCPSRNARLVGHGLERRPLHGCILHAYTPSHQLWDHTTISDAFFQMKGRKNEYKTNLAIAAPWLHACASIAGSNQAH